MKFLNTTLLTVSILAFPLFVHAESDLTSRISKAFDSCELFDYSTLSSPVDLKLAVGSQIMTSPNGTYVRNSSGGIVFLSSQSSKALVGEDALVMLSKDMVAVINNGIRKSSSRISSVEAEATYNQLQLLCSGISSELDNAILRIKTLGQ